MKCIFCKNLVDNYHCSICSCYYNGAGAVVSFYIRDSEKLSYIDCIAAQDISNIFVLDIFPSKKEIRCVPYDSYSNANIMSFFYKEDCDMSLINSLISKVTKCRIYS